MWASGVLAIGVLVALAVRADSEAPAASPWLTAMDVAVGLAFVAAGVAAKGSLRERALMAAVGPAWLAGSFLVGARSLHQAVLVVALVAFPAGRVRGIASGCWWAWPGWPRWGCCRGSVWPRCSPGSPRPSWVEPGRPPRPVELDLVFRTERGTPVNPNHASRAFARMAASVGLAAHPHLMRHALASAMAANKEPPASSLPNCATPTAVRSPSACTSTNSQRRRHDWPG
jgi:hypothetical protein